MSYDELPRFVRDPDPSVYLGDNYVVLDVETTNKEHGSALDAGNSLLLSCWSLGRSHAKAGDGRDYACWGSEFGQLLLVEHIESADFLICHNTKFELGWLKRCGVDLRRILPFDTMIGEKVILGNRKASLSLQSVATRRGLGSKDATAASLIKGGVCPSNIPTDLLEEYCRQDVELTEQVYLQQRIELHELGLLPTAYSRNLVTPVLSDIEFNGMCLDPARVKETYEQFTQSYASLEKEFLLTTGGVNVKSSKQMREYIYGKLGFAEIEDYRGNPIRTDKGEPSTSKSTVAALKAVTPEQEEFKRLAGELAKLKVPVQNLKKMQAICEATPDDPRVFATYNQTVTATDRLSSTARNGGFQFHNFDRQFKRLFRARKTGWLVCEGDAPQLEFRVAAFLGDDAQAISDIQEGVDIHSNTAAVFKCSRQDAKSKTFAPLYGATSGDKRTIKYRDYFRTRYAGIFRTQTEWTMLVARDKFLTTRTGLRFYWPDTEIQCSGYVKNTTSIFNYPIQSLATADIIPLTLVLLWHRLGAFGDSAIITNTIHDSIVLEVKESFHLAGQSTRLLLQSFKDDSIRLLKGIYGIDFTVPLGVGIKAGEFWGEGAEVKA